MTLDIDWAGADPNPPYQAHVEIPQAYLTLISGTLYELDTDLMWSDMKDREDDEDGIPFSDQQIRAPAVTIVGVTLAPVYESIAEVQFEDTGSAYTVRLVGTNNNLFDVESGILVPTPLVTVIGQNSAGLIIVISGSGLDAGQDAKLTGIYDGVFGQKIMRVSVAPLASDPGGPLPGFMLLYDAQAVPVLMGHKELWEDEAMTIGWSDEDTIYFEGVLTAGPPP